MPIYYAQQGSPRAHGTMGQAVLGATPAYAFTPPTSESITPYFSGGTGGDVNSWLRPLGLSCDTWQRMSPAEKTSRLHAGYPNIPAWQLVTLAQHIDYDCSHVILQKYHPSSYLPDTSKYTFYHPSGQATDAAQGAAQGAVDHGAPAPEPAPVPAPGMLSSVGFWRAATAATALVGVLAYHYKK